MSMADHKIPYAPVNNSNWNTIETKFGTEIKTNVDRIKKNVAIHLVWRVKRKILLRQQSRLQKLTVELLLRVFASRRVVDIHDLNCFRRGEKKLFRLFNRFQKHPFNQPLQEQVHSEWEWSSKKKNEESKGNREVVKDGKTVFLIHNNNILLHLSPSTLTKSPFSFFSNVKTVKTEIDAKIGVLLLAKPKTDSIVRAVDLTGFLAWKYTNN